MEEKLNYLGKWLADVLRGGPRLLQHLAYHRATSSQWERDREAEAAQRWNSESSLRWNASPELTRYPPINKPAQHQQSKAHQHTTLKHSRQERSKRRTALREGTNRNETDGTKTLAARSSLKGATCGVNVTNSTESRSAGAGRAWSWVRGTCGSEGSAGRTATLPLPPPADHQDSTWVLNGVAALTRCEAELTCESESGVW